MPTIRDLQHQFVELLDQERNAQGEERRALQAELSVLQGKIQAVRREQIKEWQKPGEARRIALGGVKNAFELPKSAHNKFQTQIHQIIKNINKEARKVVDSASLQTFLNRMQLYELHLAKFAKNTALQMLKDVQRRNNKAWDKYMGRSHRIYLALKKTVDSPEYKATFDRMADEAAGYIKTLPRDAAELAVDRATKGYYAGRRPEDIMKEIRGVGSDTDFKARRIARTELSRAAGNLTRARAESAGSETYIWHSSHDARTRPMHLELNGTVQRWDDPPVCEVTGERANPGGIWNCRCWAEPIFPADLPYLDENEEDSGYSDAVDEYNAERSRDSFAEYGEEFRDDL